MALYLPEEINIIANKLASIEDEYQQTLSQIKYIESKDSLQINSHYAGPKSTENNTDVLIEQEVENLKNLKAELNALLVRLKEDHPDVKILRKKIAVQESELKKIEDQPKVAIPYHGQDSGDLQKLQARGDYLKGQISNLSRKRRELQKNIFTLEKLTAELENNRQTLNMLRTKLEDARILEANESEIGSIKIIDRAFPPPHPLKKQKVILLALGTILSILFGIGVAFISEYFDDSIKTIEEAENYLNVTVIGAVPKITKKMRKR
jgi:uncharacterized protein involved in exopolysaccharide biosynthesis